MRSDSDKSNRRLPRHRCKEATKYSPSITLTTLHPQAPLPITHAHLTHRRFQNDELNDMEEQKEQQLGTVTGGEIAPFVDLGDCRGYLHVSDGMPEWEITALEPLTADVGFR